MKSCCNIPKQYCQAAKSILTLEMEKRNLGKFLKAQAMQNKWSISLLQGLQ